MALRVVAVTALVYSFAAHSATLPTVASINLCSDQLVLSVAAPEQILTVSWLAADPEESMLADRARHYPPNYGSAEEILRLGPDVVIGGIYTNAFTRQLLRERGVAVVDIVPADSVADVERNLRQVGVALHRAQRAEELVATMRATVGALALRRPPTPVPSVVIEPGGFTVGRPSLADTLMTLAGVANVAADNGLDRWGSLSMETLVRAAPKLLIDTGYRRSERSLANLVLEHPALASVAHSALVVTVPARYWSCGAPESLRSAEILQAALQPAGS